MSKMDFASGFLLAAFISGFSIAVHQTANPPRATECGCKQCQCNKECKCESK